MKKVSNFISRFNHSAEAKIQLRKIQQDSKIAPKLLIKPSKTRWGSWIAVLKRFLELEEYSRILAKKKNWTFPTEDEISFLNDCLRLLEPFGDVLKVMQAELEPKISEAYINIKLLRNILIEFEVQFLQELSFGSYFIFID